NRSAPPAKDGRHSPVVPREAQLLGARAPSLKRLVSVLIFGAMLGIRLGPWPVGEPVADDPTEIARPVLPVHFRDPAAPEAIVPPPVGPDRNVHHIAARQSPPRLGRQ